jgi:hypothetical protein
LESKVWLSHVREAEFVTENPSLKLLQMTLRSKRDHNLKRLVWIGREVVWLDYSGIIRTRSSIFRGGIFGKKEDKKELGELPAVPGEAKAPIIDNKGTAHWSRSSLGTSKLLSWNMNDRSDLMSLS